MNIIAVDTSTSIGFDNIKETLIDQVNSILDGHEGLVVFFNTRIDGIKHTRKIKDRDFDMRGSSAIWDSLYTIIDDHRHLYSVNLFVITDGKDTSSCSRTFDDVEYELWFLQLVKFWNVNWIDWKPLKRSCAFFS